MRIELLGPEGVKARVRELQAKVDSLNPRSFQDYLGAPTSATLGKPGGLTGAISTGGSSPQELLGGFAPVTLDGADLNPMAPAQIKNLVRKIAREEGIDEVLFEALVAKESSFNPNARSAAGAMGLTQLMPGTAKELGVENPFDPEQNLRGGAKYLAQQLMKFGDARLALAAFNAGPGAVIKAGNQVPDYKETKKYVNDIMNLVEARNR